MYCKELYILYLCHKFQRHGYRKHQITDAQRLFGVLHVVDRQKATIVHLRHH